MHEERQDWLDELAAAVADGRVLDWDALESSARSDAERESIRRLRAVAAIGQAHSELTFADSLSESLSARSLLHAHEDSSTPAHWGTLRILERVGRGRFGDVYRAWDPSLDREVALKLLRRRDAESAHADREVIEEGRLMARVRHPNVVTIHGAQRINGRTGLWMEFVEGRTLEAELKERGPFTAAEVIRVGVELCRALGAVHEAGLVHRDVKAQNVLRDQRGHILLGDFGTGHELDDHGVGLTDIAGTPAYLAPEIFTGAAATPRSDIYSLGVLLFRLATATYPVVGRSISQIRAAHANNSRTSITALRSDLPTALAAAIERATDVDPVRRFDSAAAMETALAADAGGTARTTSVRKLALGAAVIAAVTGVTVWVAVENGGNGRAGADAGAGTATNGARVFRQIGGADLAGPGRPSPDGRLLSMVLEGELGLHEVATGKRWKLTGEQSGDQPGWVEHSQFSLDGSRITYLRFVSLADPSDGAIPEIRRIAASGGRSRLIWRGEDTRSVNFYHWAGDDDLMLVGRWPPQGRSELLIIDTASGQIRASHELPSAPSLTGASLSPDGRYVAFEQIDRSTGFRDIDVWRTDINTVTPMIRDPGNDDSPVWTADGTHLLFMSNRSGSTGLWAQSVDGGSPLGAPVRIDPDVGTGAPMGGLTDAGALFMRRQIGTRDVFAVNVDPLTLRPLSEPKRVTNDPGFATGQSAWSPDGTQLAFFRNDGLRRSLVVHSMADGREREYWRPEIQGYAMPRWEPGGRALFFKGSIDDQGGLLRLDLQTGAITLVLKRWINHYEPLPVPGFIVLSDRQRREIVRVDLASGREEVIHRLQVPLTPSDMGLSNRGDRLVYSTPLGNKKGAAVRILDLAAPANVREIFRSKPDSLVVASAWSADDREVIVERDVNADGVDDDTSHVWAIDVSTGIARPIGLTVDRGLHDLRSSANGRYLSYDAGWPYQEVWVLENAAAGLPK